MGPKGRGIRPIETCVRFSETRGATNEGGDELGAIIAEWRYKIAREYAEKVAQEKTLPSAMSVKPPRTDELRTSLREGLQRAYEEGRLSVKSEIERQREDPDLQEALESGEAYRTDAGVEPDAAFVGFSDHDCSHPQLELALADVKQPKPAKGMPPSPADIDPEDILDGVADTTVMKFEQRLQQTSATSLQAAGIAGTLPESAALRAQAVFDAVSALSTGAEFKQASEDFKTIFGLGRIQEQRSEGITKYMYSNLVESDTCEECADRDGDTFGADQLDDYATPASQWCLGGDQCNCLVIGIIE